MSHPEQSLFVETVKKHLPQFFENARAVEIGSFDYNGSVRNAFSKCEYIGVDITSGPGVDVVSSGHEYKGDTNSVDTAISCECFEHNPFWKETILNMVRVVKPGGLVIFTCASRGRLEHGTARTNYGQSPGSEALGWTYYKNLKTNDIRSGVDLDALFSNYKMYYQPHSCDLYFWGLKNNGSQLEHPNSKLEALDAEIRANVLPFSSLASGGRSKAWLFLHAPRHVLKWLLPESIFQPLFISYYKTLDRLIQAMKRSARSS